MNLRLVPFELGQPDFGRISIKGKRFGEITLTGIRTGCTEESEAKSTRESSIRRWEQSDHIGVVRKLPPGPKFDTFHAAGPPFYKAIFRDRQCILLIGIEIGDS
jgi:hypothetical protein